MRIEGLQRLLTPRPSAFWSVAIALAIGRMDSVRNGKASGRSLGLRARNGAAKHSDDLARACDYFEAGNRLWVPFRPLGNDSVAAMSAASIDRWSGLDAFDLGRLAGPNRSDKDSGELQVRKGQGLNLSLIHI